MKKDRVNHSDCSNFIPIDVAKGICTVYNKEIMSDGEPCPQFDMMPKCKSCINFVNADEKDIGACKGFKDEYWTYADLRAVTCEGYQRH